MVNSPLLWIWRRCPRTTSESASIPSSCPFALIPSIIILLPFPHFVSVMRWTMIILNSAIVAYIIHDVFFVERDVTPVCFSRYLSRIVSRKSERKIYEDLRSGGQKEILCWVGGEGAVGESWERGELKPSIFEFFDVACRLLLSIICEECGSHRLS